MLDPWWNPASEAQAVDRTHRIGQTKTVMVYRLVAKDTIEQKVMALRPRKEELFQLGVRRRRARRGALTAAEIRGLIAGSEGRGCAARCPLFDMAESRHWAL